MFRLDEPLNSNERYLHGISMRLDIIIDMLSKFVDIYASDNGMPIENNTMEDIYIEEEIDEEPFIDYSVFTVTQLKGYLDSKDIKYTSTMRKDDLIALIE